MAYQDRDITETEFQALRGALHEAERGWWIGAVSPLLDVLWDMVQRDPRGVGLKKWRAMPYSLWRELMVHLWTLQELQRCTFRYLGDAPLADE